MNALYTVSGNNPTDPCTKLYLNYITALNFINSFHVYSEVYSVACSHSEQILKQWTILKFDSTVILKGDRLTAALIMVTFGKIY
jgi:hypothetical protein